MYKSHTACRDGDWYCDLSNPLQIDFVTETFAPEVNGVAMTLGRLVDGLQYTGCSIDVFRPRQSADDKPRINGAFSEYLLPGTQLPMYREMHFGFRSRQRRTLGCQPGQERWVVCFDKLVNKGSFRAMAHIRARTNARTGFPASRQRQHNRILASPSYTSD